MKEMVDERDELVNVIVGNVTVITTKAKAVETAKLIEDPRKKRALLRAAGVLVPAIREKGER